MMSAQKQELLEDDNAGEDEGGKCVIDPLPPAIKPTPA